MSVPTSYSLPRLIIVMVECILYGAYVVLFGLAMWTLPRKFNVSSVKKFFFPAIIALFLLATINVAYDLVGEGYAILYTWPVHQKTWMMAGQSILEITFAMSDILGDIVLLYRVYAVWGFRKKILVPLVLLLSIAKAFYIITIVTLIRSTVEPDKPFNSLVKVSSTFTLVFGVINAFTNVLMTLLIAGRVWWISRMVEAECTSLRRWYHRTIAVITESGVIYPLYIILEASLVFSPLWVPNPATVAIITAGLAPTLIAVRVGSGSAYDNQSLHTVMQHSNMRYSAHAESRRSPDFVFNDALVASDNAFENSSIEDIQEKVDSIV
ncbi:hypothetical protein GYMLUDRAFT_40471 [Collybiopsis luxurians FD-317 M1]|uniref:Uncharacterized protein n=1 Tax=Collybiopsis luxurians FD-317 M1 TaxID=944289 RepID=A0A0D0CM76_9AGAR|nr:hypothetical protein GYMLUDRAFT_40471 [Collybiopsis luxurians FD-317 M1]